MKITKREILNTLASSFIILIILNILFRTARGDSFWTALKSFLLRFTTFDFYTGIVIYFSVCILLYILLRYIYLLMRRKGIQFLIHHRLKILLLFCIIIISFTIFNFYDIHYLRGYYYNQFFISHINLSDSTLSADIDYKVKLNPDSTWDFYFKNNDFSYYQFGLYRNGEKDFYLEDSILAYSALRKEVTINDTSNYTDGHSFGCGTGLEFIFIKPYEEFHVKNLDIYKSFSGHDLIFWYNRLINTKEIEIEFFLPIYQIGSRVPYYAKSNPITIQSSVLLNILKQKFYNLPDGIREIFIKNAYKFNVPNLLLYATPHAEHERR